MDDVRIVALALGLPSNGVIGGGDPVTSIERLWIPASAGMTL